MGVIRFGEWAGATPGSIWQFELVKELLKLGWHTVALQQDYFGAPTPKPTRWLANTNLFEDMGVPDKMPIFDEGEVYAGPLTRSKRPQKVSLVRQKGQKGPFRSEAAAAYPAEMCQKIA